MDINFTGIKNIKMIKSRTPKTVTGLYPSVTGEIKTGEKIENNYRLTFNLTGEDYDKFIKAMSESQHGINENYFKNEPNKFELSLTRYDVVEDDIIPTSFNVFRINNENVTLTQRCGLKLYECLAHLTKKMVQMDNFSQNQRNFINMINKRIHEDAVNFIETL